MFIEFSSLFAPVKCLLFGSLMTATVGFRQQHAIHHSARHARVLSSRQHRETLAKIDTCAFIDSDTTSAALEAKGVTAKYDLDLDICVCMSSTDGFLSSGTCGPYLTHALGGEKMARIFLRDLINTNDPWSCKYPYHSKPRCSPVNPCHFECGYPRIVENGKCVCSIGWKLCNDHCIPMSHVCGSATPHLDRRGSSFDDAKRVCGSKTVCGIPGKSGMNLLPYDCVDIASDEESCGGCLAYHPFLDPNNQPTLGVDCLGIPGVKKAACIKGHCDITHCENGWKIREGACIPEWWKRGLIDAGALTEVTKLVTHGLNSGNSG